jgi:hypothetical protein
LFPRRVTKAALPLTQKGLDVDVPETQRAADPTEG